MSSDVCKVMITLEPAEPKQEHVWVQDENNFLNDVCLACGEIAYGSAGYGGVRYPSSSCPGDQ